MESPKYPIDFVVLWVDGSDSKWLKKKQQYKPDIDIADTVARYRDWGIFKYWFRAVEKYAPWVNHIYLVTDNQKPEWLNEKHPKLTIIDHKDILELKNLPVYNASAIEINIHRIPNLSNHFVFFNDDMFIVNKVKPTDFFKNNLPVEIANLNAATGMEGDQLFAKLMFNDTLLINRHFNKKDVVHKHPSKWLNPKYGTFNIRTLSQIIYPYFTGYRPRHLPAPFLKSTFEELWQEEGDILRATSSHKFRHENDVNQHAFIQWQLCKNQFVPGKESSGRYIRLDNSNINKVTKVIRSRKLKTICINDGVSNNIKKTEYIRIQRRLVDAFEEKLPSPSSFEKNRRLKILHVLDVKQASGNGVAEAVRQYVEQEIE